MIFSSNSDRRHHRSRSSNPGYGRTYSYSGERLTYVEAKWTFLRCTVYGALFGCMFFAAFFFLNPSGERFFRSRAADDHENENVILLRELNILIPRLPALKQELVKLQQRSVQLDTLLFRSTNGMDSISSLSIEARIFRFHSSLLLANELRPQP